MNNDPDQIRADIGRTRERLSNNADGLTDAVKPSVVARRQVEKIKSELSGSTDHLMGEPSDVRPSIGESPHSAPALPCPRRPEQ